LLDALGSGLENDLQGELNLTGSGDGFGNASGIDISQCGGDERSVHRTAEIGAIQDVEELRSELQVMLLAEVNVLLEGKVHRQDTRHLQGIPSQIAQISGAAGTRACDAGLVATLKNLKLRGIEVKVGIAAISQDRTAVAP